MQFKLSTTVALLLLFLTGPSLAYNSCYEAGQPWSDLGTDSEIDGALNALCNDMQGKQRVADTNFGCINLNDNHIVASIQITMGPAFGANVNWYNCMDVISQVKGTCPDYGGQLEDIKTYGVAQGGSEFTAVVRADPQKGYDKTCPGV